MCCGKGLGGPKARGLRGRGGGGGGGSHRPFHLFSRVDSFDDSVVVILCLWVGLLVYVCVRGV